jgi:para-aminobenzoate synthetase/4-amino-4-deoxychorismate lyase
MNARSFELLETMKWTPGEGFWLLDRHLDRLRRSADHFGFLYKRTLVDAALASVSPAATSRVRLLVGPDGHARIEVSAFVPFDRPLAVRLADQPIDPSDELLYHKTTHRSLYERMRRSDADDVLLWNVIGEITESTIANVVVEIGGRRITPPVECGLLAGVFRAELLDTGEIEERVVLTEQVKTAPRIWLVNSVRGWCPATLLTK